jgi:hypothetical protein
MKKLFPFIVPGATVLPVALGAACTNSFDPTNPAASGFSLILSDTFPGTALDKPKWCPN